jgi:hypothetical protein
MDFQKNNKQIIIIIIIAAIFIEHIINNSPDVTSKWDFKGPVQKVWYDLQCFPHVIVNGKEYDLVNTTWHFKIPINVGDTIIKKSGDMHIEVIRANTHDTIIFKNRRTTRRF